MTEAAENFSIKKENSTMLSKTVELLSKVDDLGKVIEEKGYKINLLNLDEESSNNLDNLSKELVSTKQTDFLFQIISTLFEILDLYFESSQGNRSEGKQQFVENIYFGLQDFMEFLAHNTSEYYMYIYYQNKLDSIRIEYDWQNIS